MAGRTENGGKEDVKITVLLEYLSNFWKILEMSLINCEILRQLKPAFKRTINWNKYQSKEWNQYLDYLIDPIFQGANRRFVLSFELNTSRTSYKQHYLPRLEIKDYQ